MVSMLTEGNTLVLEMLHSLSQRDGHAMYSKYHSWCHLSSSELAKVLTAATA